MKKLFLLVAVLTPLLGISQSEEKAVRKDNTIIDLYIGGPQLLSRLSNTSSDRDGISVDLKGRGHGPYGGRVEYMITRKSSLGLDINHAYSALDITWNDGKDKLEQRFSMTRTRFVPRYALHFGGRKLDAFWHIGLGVALWDIGVEVKDPSSTITPDNDLTRVSGPVIAFRTGIGLRYFFTDHFGINGDFGIGGALFTLGATGKF